MTMSPTIVDCLKFYILLSLIFFPYAFRLSNFCTKFANSTYNNITKTIITLQDIPNKKMYSHNLEII